MLEIGAVDVDSPARLAAVAQARRVLPGMSIPLDAVARIAARAVGAPIAVVGLVDATEEEFVGSFGLPTSFATSRRVARDDALCAAVVHANHDFMVADMTVDERWATHPLVTTLSARSFAGTPLRDSDQRPVGAVTVIDTRPRPWTKAQLSALAEIAGMLTPAVSSELDSLAVLCDPIAAHPLSAAVGMQVQQGFIAALLDSVQVGVVAFDNDRHPILFNRALRQLHGLDETLSPAEAMERAYSRLHHLDGSPMAPDEMSVGRALDGETVRDLPAVLVMPGMPDRYVLANGQPVRSADGRQIGAVATILDVTERHRGERFRDCQLDIATVLNESHTVQQAGPQVTEVLGKSLGWAYVSLWLVDEMRDVLRRRADWTAPGYEVADLLPEEVQRGECPTGIVWETGRALWIPDYPNSVFAAAETETDFAAACAAQGMHTVLVVPIRDGERTLGALSCLCDAEETDEYLLTGLVEAIAAQIGHFLARQRAAELALELVRAKDDFLDLVGHELRTPLTSITTYSELLLGDPNLTADAQNLVEVVNRNATRLRVAIEGLLDLAALESGHMRMQSQQVDLAGLVAERCAAAPAPPDVRIRTDLPSSLLVIGDRDRLQQTVDILLSNAIKYSPDGGDIAVRLSPRHGVAELTVTDTGIGVPLADRDQLFHRFFRATNVRHSAISGTGLGLTKARILVEAHHGTIALDWAAEKGTRIVVRLPLYRDPGQH